MDSGAGAEVEVHCDVVELVQDHMGDTVLCLGAVICSIELLHGQGHDVVHEASGVMEQVLQCLCVADGGQLVVHGNNEA